MKQRLNKHYPNAEIPADTPSFGSAASEMTRKSVLQLSIDIGELRSGIYTFLYNQGSSDLTLGMSPAISIMVQSKS